MESSEFVVADLPCVDADKVTPRQYERLTQAMRFIRAHYHRSPRLKEVAAAAELSPFHFHRLFRTCYGKTFKHVITELQVDLAKRLLLRGVPTHDAGEQCGFANQSHFTGRFRLLTGTTPAAWAKTHRRARSNQQN